MVEGESGPVRIPQGRVSVSVELQADWKPDPQAAAFIYFFIIIFFYL